MKLDYNFIDLSVKKIMEVTGCDLIEGIKIIEILSTRDYFDFTDKYIDDEYSYLLFEMNGEDDKLFNDIRSIFNKIKISKAYIL